MKKGEKWKQRLFCSQPSQRQLREAAPHTRAAGLGRTAQLPPENLTQHPGTATESICALTQVILFTMLSRCVLRPQKSLKAGKGVTLSVKLDVIKHIWYELVGYILGLGNVKIFLFKLMVIASSLYDILAYKRFHRKSLLLDSGGVLYVSWTLTSVYLGINKKYLIW